LNSVPLRIVVGDYDRTRALLSGSVRFDGFETCVISGDLEEIFAKAFSSAEYEVTELSFSNFLIASVRGDCPYLALPIFPSRSFRHSAIYVRRDSGIATPADLKGKRIGTREYSNTLSLVVKGTLSDEYGLKPEDCDWVVGDIDHVERTSIDRRNWPAEGVRIEGVVGETLSTQMDRGALDALIAYTPPACFRGGAGSCVRLFPDWRPVEQDYYRRTRRFPIMHVVGIRKDVLAQHPTLPKALVAGFNAAKAHALGLLAVHQAPPITLPWMTAETEATQALMGTDFWPYGLDANREVLQAQIRWSFEQRLIPRAPALDEIFVPA
jgi:4,5-dihydroxyphthalate decarboxylase